MKSAAVTSVPSGVAAGRRVRAMASVVACSMLIALSAQVRIYFPGSDVPMTLQLLAVLLTGFWLPPGQAIGAVLVYLGCGAAGLPVFSGAGGLSGPTGGYLVGFLAAVALVSTLKGGHRAGWWRLVMAGFAGTVVIFTIGVSWRIVLALTLGLGEGNVVLAAASGLIPFLGKAVVELLLAVTLVVAMRGLSDWRKSGRSARSD